MMPAAQKTILATAALLCLTSTTFGMSWRGDSNAHGGIVEYGYFVDPSAPDFDPEMSESGWLGLRCDGYDGRLTFSFMGDHSAEGFDVHRVIFIVGGDRFERDGWWLGNEGLFPATPLVEVLRGDPLIHALARSAASDAQARLEMHVGSVREYPTIDAPIGELGELFSQHLKACL